MKMISELIMIRDKSFSEKILIFRFKNSMFGSGSSYSCPCLFPYLSNGLGPSVHHLSSVADEHPSDMWGQAPNYGISSCQT